MRTTIHFQPSTSKKVVILHWWTPLQNGMDVEGTRGEGGGWTFELADDRIADARNVRFKYRFARGDHDWEDDRWERRIPCSRPAELWTYEHSPRCTGRNPGGAPADRLVVHALSKRKFAGGYLYLWDPMGRGAEAYIPGQQQGEVTTFQVPLAPWMRQGFHFKLNNCFKFEPDEYNRVWRPGDGAQVWIKSGQLELHAQRPEQVEVRLELLHPLAADPLTLRFEDAVDEFAVDVMRSAPTRPFDELFGVSTFTVSAYRGGLYDLWVKDLEHPETRRRAFVADEVSTEPFPMVLGDSAPLERLPAARSAEVEVIVHPNPGTQFRTVEVKVGIGSWYREGDRQPHQLVPAASEGPPGSPWRARIRVFPGVRHWVSLREQGSTSEVRSDGPFDSCRFFTVQAGRHVLHTVDGVPGVSASGGPAFANPPSRRALMGAAFGQAIADGGVFDAHEMPHGAIVHGGKTWFTLKAPHAVQASVLLLRSAEDEPRRADTVEMQLTEDLRYFWCAVDGAGPGTLYRFLLNGTQEVLDPAARSLHDPGTEENRRGLWPESGEGRQGPWSVVVDLDALDAVHRGSPWRTMGWDALAIWELHAARLTRRNGAPSPFDELVKELQRPDGYVRGLPATALELLPANEFSKDNSWGYSGSTIFAIESSYGGPEGLARLSRACHDAGRAFMVDLVYNHMTSSPLQAVASDVYTRGETPWGAMPRYGHPATVEIFRQAIVHMWRTFRLDGFRLDATAAIINGHVAGGGNEGNVRVAGDCGWEFLRSLDRALERAADAVGEPWPYVSAECAPENFGACRQSREHAYAAAWDFSYHYRLGDLLENADGDRAGQLGEELLRPQREGRPAFEEVLPLSTHDSDSLQEPFKKRPATRERWGNGYRMLKAAAATTLLGRGVPLMFMGDEAGETKPFTFDFRLSDDDAYLDLDGYQTDPQRSKLLAWSRELLAFRNAPDGAFRASDDEAVSTGCKTVAFTRGGGRYMVIATFGTSDTVQRLSWLGLPEGRYKEVLNSTWDAYRVNEDGRVDNGHYAPILHRDCNVNLPAFGAVVLERC